MGHDIFLSWSHRDRRFAEWTRAAMELRGWRVFWSHAIPAGQKWYEYLRRRLETAACVVVLWSEASAKSFWVKAEAAEAASRDRLLSARISKTAVVPSVFQQSQIHDLAGWTGRPRGRQIAALCRSVALMLGDNQVDQSWFCAIEDDELVGRDDITLVHTTWRAPEYDEKYENAMYRVHAIVHGHPSVLRRIRSVEYYFEEWRGDQLQTGGSRARNFEVNELAWGDFMLKATVRFKRGEPDLELSRFVNLAKEGPRLDRFMLMQRRLHELR